MPTATNETIRAVRIAAGRVVLQGDLIVPTRARGVVLFADGSGSSRHSRRNRAVAEVLRAGEMATLLMDLLTVDEEAMDVGTGRLRFDIPLLAARLVAATDWLKADTEMRAVPLGYFGTSTGAAAALMAAVERPRSVGAIVSRGGRPGLAGPSLSRVAAPTLLIVGSDDYAVIRMNQDALAQMRAEAHLEIVPGAGHLFEESGTLKRVAELARAWFEHHLLERQVQS